jgi:hypothetical protein
MNRSHVSEEAVETGFAVHVAGRKDKDAETDAGDDQHEDRREGIELIAPLDVEQSGSRRFRRCSARRSRLFFGVCLRLRFVSRFSTLIDADRATRNPVETKTVLTRDVRLGPFGMTAEAI